MRSLRLLALRRLRQAPGRAAITVVAIAAGVSLAVSISVLLTSIDRSIAAFGSDLAGPAPLRLTGATFRGGLPEAAADRAAEVDGVAAVVPMVQTASLVQEQPGGPLEPVLVLGVDCRVEALFGSFGCDPAALESATGALGVGPGVTIGGESVLRTDTGRLALGGAPVLAGVQAGSGRSVVLPLHVAQERFTRPGQLDVAYLVLRDGADVEAVAAAVQRAVGDHLPVLAASDPPPGASTILGGALPIYSLLGVFALGIGGVLVSNIAAMSLESRRRELAVLGAIGGRPRTLVGATVAEMAVLGLAGGLLGAGGGALVAAPIVHSLSSFTEQVAGLPLTVRVSTSTLVTGALLGLLVAVGAALIPARRAVRMEVAAELSGRESGDRARPVRLGRRLAGWSLVTAAGVVGCWAAPRAGGLEPWQAAVVTPSFLLVTVGTLFGSAAAAPMLVGRLQGRDLAGRSAPVRIGLAAARRDHRRTSVLAITLGAAVATAFVTEGSSASARRSIEEAFRRVGEGVEVATVPSDTSRAAFVEPALVDRLRSVPGVERVDMGTFVLAGRDGAVTLVQAMTGNPLSIDLVDGVADPSRLAAGEVLIGAGLARREGVRAGDKVSLVTPAGPVEVPVQGVWADGNNVGVNVTMAPDLLTELYGPQPPSAVVARPAPGVSEPTLRARIEAAGLDPELEARTSSEVADDIADQVDTQFASFRVMQRALLGVLFVAVLSSLLLAGIQRRRELGLLAAVGAEPRGLARTLLAETGIVALSGLACSLVVGPLMAWALNRVLPFVVGFVNPLVLDWGAFATAGALATIVALLGAAWPAYRASRVEVLEALRYE